MDRGSTGISQNDQMYKCATSICSILGEQISARNHQNYSLSPIESNDDNRI